MSEGSNNLDLDELAADAEAESGDAAKAWRLLAKSIDKTDLPIWVKGYVRKSAAAVARYDGDQVKLAAALGFWREHEEPPSLGYDLDHLIDWFSEKMAANHSKRKRQSVSSLAKEYWEQVMKQSGTPGGVRKAYERARNRDIAGIKSDIELDALLAKRGVVVGCIDQQ